MKSDLKNIPMVERNIELNLGMHLCQSSEL
jgi:hypothetical protein